jgi:hypothetical protein
MEKRMLKQLHQLTQEVKGKVHTYATEITADITDMEQALLAFLQFLGQVKAQQAAAQAAAQAPAPTADVAAVPVPESQTPPQVVD